jgi:hypothetical protein
MPVNSVWKTKDAKLGLGMALRVIREVQAGLNAFREKTYLQANMDDMRKVDRLVVERRVSRPWAGGDARRSI